MSEEKTNNLFVGLAGFTIVIAVVGWFSTTSNISAETVAVNETETEEKIVHVHSTEAPEEVAEEVIVVADELVEKAQEAAVRNQANQTMSKPDTREHIADAE